MEAYLNLTKVFGNFAAPRGCACSGNIPFRVTAFENEMAPFEASAARQRKSHSKTKQLHCNRSKRRITKIVFENEAVVFEANETAAFEVKRDNEKLLGSFELKSYHCGKQDLNLHES